ncbi:MAG: AI-2E family transporter [bacterium]|nr:AI-2E family transporter [bacterium]
MTAAGVIVVAGLRAAGAVLIPFMFAIFLALIGFPIVEWLCRKGVRLSLAVLVTVLLECAALSILGYLISSTFNEFARAAPAYLNGLVEKTRALLTTLQERGIDLSTWISPDRLDAGAIMDLAGGIVRGTVKGVASFVSYVLLVFVILITAMFEVVALPEKLKRTRYGKLVSRNVKGVMADIQRYLGVKTLVSFATGVLVGLGVWIVDLPVPLFWAVLAFLLNYIPAIGSIIAAVPAVLVALVQQGWGTALVVAILFLAINFLLGNLIEPVLMGRQFGLSTLVVFMAMVFWGWIWGPIGMILSVPLTMIIKIVLEQSEELRWLAVLMGPAAPMAAAAAARHADKA